MDEFIAARPNRQPTHPGALLRETILPATGMTVKDAAAALRITREQLHRILSEQSGISPEMALMLGKFCGNGSKLLMRMQEAYDIWQGTIQTGKPI